MFEDFKEDWATYDGDLTRRGLWTMAVYRFGQWRYTIKSSLIRKPFSLLYKVLKVVSEIVTHVELPCEAVVGRRLSGGGGHDLNHDTCGMGDGCLRANQKRSLLAPGCIQ